MSVVVKRKWAIDLNQDSKVSQHSRQSTKVDTTDLKLKKAWELAKSPGKSIFMQAFMMWMAGSSVNIFSIMITVYAMIGPIRAIFGLNSAFSKFDLKQGLIEPKLVYVGLNLLTVAVAVYKCHSLGFLPTTDSDWVSILPVPQPVEYSGGGFSL